MLQQKPLGRQGGEITVLTPVKCPHCGSDDVKKNGTSENGKQRFLCCNEKCPHKTFLEHYTYNAWEPSIRSRIFFSTVNGSGRRATARTPGTAKDEMPSFVGDKSRQYWLWRATDHNTGEPLAFHFGTREHKNLDELLALLRPFDITIAYSDNNYACRSHITDSEVVTCKENTQKN